MKKTNIKMTDLIANNCVFCAIELPKSPSGYVIGNNPAPEATFGQCCDTCNEYVIRARMKMNNEKSSK